ncbi:MAG: hypothetical protein AAF604_16035 [Acidobacteriota bacterium]
MSASDSKPSPAVRRKLENRRTRLVALARQVRAIDVSKFESSSDDRVQETLVPVVRDIAKKASQVFATAPDPDHEIADLFDVASLEVEVNVARLERVLERSDTLPKQLYLSCSILLSSLLRAAVALENRLAFTLQRTAELSLREELEVGLAIRRDYRRFEGWVSAFVDRSGEELRRDLDAGATALAWLRSRPSFDRMRFSDRRELFELERRTREWLDSDGASEPGRGLRSDIGTYSKMVQLINARTEIFDHDRQLTADLLAALDDLDEDASLDEELLERTQRLLGRCTELDCLLDHWPEAPASSWRRILNRLATTLGLE